MTQKIITLTDENAKFTNMKQSFTDCIKKITYYERKKSDIYYYLVN